MGSRGLDSDCLRRSYVEFRVCALAVDSYGVIDSLGNGSAGLGLLVSLLHLCGIIAASGSKEVAREDAGISDRKGRRKDVGGRKSHIAVVVSEMDCKKKSVAVVALIQLLRLFGSRAISFRNELVKCSAASIIFKKECSARVEVKGS